MIDPAPPRAPLPPLQPLLLPLEAGESPLTEPAGVRPKRAAAKQAAKHPRNTLNELSGEEWVFFTKSVITTAFPSDYGHQLRKAHGANKPPQGRGERQTLQEEVNQ